MAGLTLLERLAAAQAEIDAWEGGEFSSPDYGPYQALADELARLSAADRREVVLALDDPRAEIRREAATAARSLALAEAIAKLATVVGDPDAIVRISPIMIARFTAS